MKQIPWRLSLGQCLGQPECLEQEKLLRLKGFIPTLFFPCSEWPGLFELQSASTCLEDEKEWQYSFIHCSTSSELCAGSWTHYRSPQRAPCWRETDRSVMIVVSYVSWWKRGWGSTEKEPGGRRAGESLKGLPGWERRKSLLTTLLSISPELLSWAKDIGQDMESRNLQLCDQPLLRLLGR